MNISDIEKSRPNTVKGTTEHKVFDRLDKLNIDYEVVTSDEAYTMEECSFIDKKLDTTVWKSIFLCNQKKTSFYLVVMPPFKDLDSKKLESKIGIKLSFASEEYMIKHLGTKPGSASIMGLINDLDDYVQLFVDKEVMESEFFGCNPGINTIHLKIKTTDVINKFIPSTYHKVKILDL